MTAAWWRDRALLGVVVVAVALRIAPWLWPHTFLGIQESDDGVYYAASRALLGGLLPYRDVTIVHPPGVSVLLLPFALLGRATSDPVGLAAARLAVVAVAVANLLLVHRLALRLPAPAGRARLAALTAAAVYALSPGAVVAEHTVLLEPLVTLLCLLAVVVLLDGRSRRRAVAAGVLLALAVSVKLFACLYAAVLVGWLLSRRQVRRAAGVTAGAVLGAAVVIGPFALLAPSAFVRDVVLTQLQRPADATDSGLLRLGDLLGLELLHVGGVLAAVALAVLLVRLGRPAPEPLLWLALLVLGGAAFLSSPSYFPHYAAFLAPPLALVLHRPVAARRGTALVAGLVLTMAAGSVVDVVRSRGQGDPERIRAVVPADACVFSELVSTGVAAGLFSLPTKDCPGWIDGRGVAYTRAGDFPADRDYYPAGFVEDEGWQAELRTQLVAADALLLGESAHDVPEWSEQTRAYVLGHFRQALVSPGPGHASVQVWLRTSR